MATVEFRNAVTGELVAVGDVIEARDGTKHTLVGYEPDGAGSGFIISIRSGKWGVKNHEEHRPHFFRMEVWS